MTVTTHRNAVALFVRHPIPGRVKTRLAHDLGEAAACNLYRAMVSDILGNIKVAELPIFIFHDGKDGTGLPEEWTKASLEIIRQEGDSLGERMTAAFERLFTAGIERVALIGSDIPGLDAPLLQAAFAALDHRDAAIAPARDGGYCLIAFKRERFYRQTLQNIPWSTSLVLSQTLEAFSVCELEVELLDTRQDIDTIRDLQDYSYRLSESAPATNEWLRSGGYLRHP